MGETVIPDPIQEQVIPDPLPSTAKSPRSVPNTFDVPPLTSQWEATKYGLGRAASGFVDTLKSAAEQMKPQESSDWGALLLGGPALALIKRGIQDIPQGLAPLARAGEIPGAIKDIANSPSPLSALAQTAPYAGGQGAAQFALAGAVKGAGQLASKLSPAPLTASQAASQITDAINPAAKQLPKYQQDLTAHMDKVVQYANDNNMPLNSAANLQKALKGTSDLHRSVYYDQMLNPVRNQVVGTSDIAGYSGDTSGTSQATLGQLDARLSRINADLNPKYAKGGIAAQAAVKSTGELQAEGAAIRNKLYNAIAERTGLDPAQVAQTRSTFGALDDLAEKTGLSINKARTAANRQAQAPISVNPFGHSGKQFILDKLLNAARGNVVDNSIGKTFSNFSPSSYSPSVPSGIASVSDPTLAMQRALAANPSALMDIAKAASEREMNRALAANPSGLGEPR